MDEEGDVIAAIAPPPPREVWRWAAYAAAVVAIALAFAATRASSAAPSLGLISSPDTSVTANDDGSHTYRIRLRNVTSRSVRVERIESAHEGVQIETIEGLPASIEPADGLSVSLRLRVACPSAYPPRIRVHGEIVRLARVCEDNRVPFVPGSAGTPPGLRLPPLSR